MITFTLTVNLTSFGLRLIGGEVFDHMDHAVKYPKPVCLAFQNVAVFLLEKQPAHGS